MTFIATNQAAFLAKKKPVGAEPAWGCMPVDEGDVIILRPPKDMRSETISDLVRIVGDAFGDNRVVVIPEGMDIALVKMESQLVPDAPSDATPADRDAEVTGERLTFKDDYLELRRVRSDEITVEDFKANAEAGNLRSVPLEEANLISSLTRDGKHRPVLDLDVPHHYVPSGTPGHGHLYLDLDLEASEYRLLIGVLVSLGILGAGSGYQLDAFGMSMVRKPSCPKPQYDDSQFPAWVKEALGAHADAYLRQLLSESPTSLDVTAFDGFA